MYVKTELHTSTQQSIKQKFNLLTSNIHHIEKPVKWFAEQIIWLVLYEDNIVCQLFHDGGSYHIETRPFFAEQINGLVSIW